MLRGGGGLKQLSRVFKLLNIRKTTISTPPHPPKKDHCVELMSVTPGRQVQWVSLGTCGLVSAFTPGSSSGVTGYMADRSFSCRLLSHQVQVNMKSRLAYLKVSQVSLCVCTYVYMHARTHTLCLKALQERTGLHQVTDTAGTFLKAFSYWVH